MTPPTTDETPRSGPPIIDIHVHLVGVGTGGSGCWVSPRLRRRPTFAGLRLLMGVSRRQMATTIDQDWAAEIARRTAASEVDYSVVLGFDGAYDSQGRFDEARSQLVAPPDWVFEVCQRYGNLLPGPSINPERRDALERLEEVIERGAVLIKWLPIVQGFDPAGPAATRFLQRMAEARLPLLVHAGSGEVTFRSIRPEVGGLERIEPALDLGVTVICAHTAAPVHLRTERSQVPLLRELLQRYPNLFVDNSGMANPSRFMHLPRFADDPLITSRTLHGSDYPVPCNPIYYVGRMERNEVTGILREKNRIQRELLVKRAIGYPDVTFHRAAEVLPDLARWIGRSARGAG